VAGLAGQSAFMDEKSSRKPRPAPDLPPCFDDVTVKNIIDCTTVTDETICDKKTGEELGPYCIATHIKVFGKDKVFAILI
jgi:hypothetical protein